MSNRVESISAEELIEEFELFDDWEERYRYIIETGNSMPPLEAKYQTEENRVQGCLSSVWLVIEETEDGRRRVRPALVLEWLQFLHKDLSFRYKQTRYAILLVT